jgi:hypothetical protein
MRICKRIILFSSLIFFIIIVMQACDPICTDLDPTYNFSVMASVFPSKDSISVGDTVYLISSFPSTLINQSGELIDYSNAKSIGCAIGFNDLNKVSVNDSSTTKSFSYENLEGEIYNDKKAPTPWLVDQIKYEEVKDSYHLKIGFIPKKPGTYALIITDLYSSGLINRKGCYQASFGVTFTNIDQHLYFYENLFGVGVLSEHDYGRTYCFKVVK